MIFAGNPDNTDGNEDCGEIVPDSDKRGHLNDKACSTQQHYLCMKAGTVQHNKNNY